MLLPPPSTVRTSQGGTDEPSSREKRLTDKIRERENHSDADGVPNRNREAWGYHIKKKRGLWIEQFVGC